LGTGRQASAAKRGGRDFARTDRARDVRAPDPGQGPSDALLRLFAADDIHSLIPREWPNLAIVMIIGLLVIAGVNRAIPTLSVALPALLGCTIVALTSKVRVYERRAEHDTATRVALFLAVVAVPLLLYGAATAIWAIGGGASWPTCIAVLVIVSLLASVLASGRTASVLAVQLASWAGVACAVSPIAGALTMAMAAGVAWLAYLRQRRIDDDQREQMALRQRAQMRAEEILSDYEETGQGWFWETDRRGAITYLSSSVAKILGRDRDELVGRPLAELFDLAERSGEGERTLTFHLSARSAFSELAVRAACKDEARWWSVNGRPTYDTFDNFQGFRGSGTDLTEKRRSEENASRLAQYDSLTGLSNRLRMSQSLEKILSAPNPAQRECCVFLIDLDRFKQVNDTLGHPAGDALLKQVAQRLERTVGKYGRVGRLGGDEFKVVLPGKIVRDKLGALANQLIETLSQPYSIDGSRVMIGASLGIALAPEDGMTSEALIRNADLALYAAKDRGRGCYHFYAADLHSDAEERRKLEEELRDAVTTGALELYYQPVVQTSTERITGFEALLRWNHPEKGWISPAKFIPIAEDTGLIAPIGEWALRKACSDLASWPENVRVAVNVSAIQFANPSLPTVVTGAIAHAQISPDRLELEITESVFLNNDDGTDAMFKALKGIGVRLALDDFGTGYSSLGYLKTAPFDKIKIDQGFVRGATQPGSRNGAIIASIVSLAEALNMETTAEGVETLDELDLVRMLGCSHVQGYIYERPLSPVDALARLRTGLVAVAQGPRAARSERQSMLRKIVLEHGGHRYPAMIRNISRTGALVEGLWNVPAGTIFGVELGEREPVTATARWCKDNRIGLEFSRPLELDQTGRIAAVSARTIIMPEPEPVTQRKVG
jgi:diguanylate cyclase (GGDEF)-like protein/PAS domain S-box-containing protein